MSGHETASRTARPKWVRRAPAGLGAIERVDELCGNILNVDEICQSRMVLEVTIIESPEEGHQRETLGKFLVQVAKTVRTRLVRLLWILVVQIVWAEREA